MSADQQDQLASANEVAQVEPPQGKSQMVAKLWEEEAPEIIGEILIRAGKDVAFRLDESAQCIELEEDLATFAPTRIRTIADAVNEPPRVSRRLNTLRGLSHEQVEQVFA